MVLQKRLDYGFSGFQVPDVPRSTRSARGRRLFKRKVEDRQMCAFELLATVAGDLLQERDSCAHSNTSPGTAGPVIAQDTVKQEPQDKEAPLKVEPCDPGSCDESVFVSDGALHGHNGNCTSKESTHVSYVEGFEIASNSDFSAKVSCAERTKEDGNQKVNLSCKVNGSACNESSSKDKFSHGIEQRLASDEQKMVNGTAQDTCSSEYVMDLDNKPPALVSSDSSAEVPFSGDHIPCSYFPKSWDNVQLVNKDDDENSSECTQPSTRTMNAFRSLSRIGDRRIRKILASKYWKVAPRLKDGELSNSETRRVFHNRKGCYTRQRSQRNSPYIRRKLFKRCSTSTCDGGLSSEDISKSLVKGVNGDGIASVSQASSSVVGQEASFHSRGSHVKLSIKSFRVPELFIEVSEMETVGSLKRAVLEAVTAILGGGVHVGVVLQGKKVRDDNKTLLQTGISHHDKLETLGFTLEPTLPPTPTTPTPTSTPPALCHEDPPHLVPQEIQNSSSSDRGSVPPPADGSVDKTLTDSRALVPIPTRVEALSVVPLQRKSRQSELVQRRMRRPFSVSEVEALVQAVEKLGTGRWRDVKLCAFDNAKHRTYVDLKDKWKTLVHTARISPQQRRGEPVPQELLDRVLAAHAYWAHQQVKVQMKQQNEQYLLI
ncbi:hypothetical protein Scep_015820 [Stephania cephalantha]|uniref:Uncharacterized protein n=1 Tax=Stephania cephalantha TaxID=152367 RepID=A0AAP0J3U4_9MAGN